MNLSLISVDVPEVNPNRETMSEQEIQKKEATSARPTNISYRTGRNENVADKKRGKVTTRVAARGRI